MTTDTNDLARQILTNAAELVLKGHHKGSYAADAFGRELSINNPDATCFCAAGAIYRSGLETKLKHSTRVAAEAEAMDRLAEAISLLDLGHAIPVWNDREETTAAHVAGAMMFAALGAES